MSQKTDNWSSSWNSSTNPSKQRKYRENAPLHVKDKLVSVNLDRELRDELGTRSIKLRTGDRVEIMRGDEAGSSGIVNGIDRQDETVFIDGIEVERQDGSKSQKPFDPSNLQVKALNVDDPERVEKFEAEDIESIKVEEEEVEEALEEDEENEMMQRMQQGESSIEADDEEDEKEEEVEAEKEEEEHEETTHSKEEENEEEKTEKAEANYEDIVGGTISDAKEKIAETDNPDFDAILKAEKTNKDRKTFKEWIESQKD